MRILITGATSGIGYEFVSIYAKTNNLVLVARDNDKLKSIKTELEKKYNNEIDIIPLDLSLANSSQKLITSLNNKNINIVINNAGIGEFGKFINSDIEKLTSMIHLNITSSINPFRKLALIISAKIMK